MSLLYSFFTKIFAFAFLVSALTLLMIPSVGFAQVVNLPDACGGKACPITGSTEIDASQAGIAGIILSVASFVTYVVGAISVLFLVYGGFLYVTDTGDDKNSGKAKKILVNAVIGLIIAIVAITIVSVIGNIVQGDLLTQT